MAIEFPCVQCGTLLRVPDEAAGKHAKCAKCGAIMLTPDASPTSGPQTTSNQPSLGGPPLAPPGTPNPPSSLGPADSSHPSAAPGPEQPTSSSSNPFDLLKPTGLERPASGPSVSGNAPVPVGGAPPNPFAEKTNPFQSPTAALNPPGRPFQRQDPYEYTKAKLVPVGISMLIVGFLSLLFHGLAIVGAMEDIGNNQLNDDDIAGLVMVAVWMVWSLVVVGSSIAMIRVKSLALCWIGAVTALIPCNCCIFIAMPVGVWACVVLADPIVANFLRGNET